MLPPPMQPQVLRRVLADQALEGRSVPLSEQADVVGGALLESAGSITSSQKNS